MNLATRKKYRILILTDHRIHSPVESIYSIARGLAHNPAAEHVHIVTRGLPENQNFFETPINIPLLASKVGDDFQHSQEGTYFLKKQISILPTDYDVVFLRLPRVNSMNFFDKISSVIPEERMINQPSGIILTGNKKYLLEFPEICPPMRFCNTVEEVIEFKEQFSIVLKPLNNSGGKGIVRIDNERITVGQTSYAWTEYLATLEQDLKQGMLAMQFLKNVDQGDKRVIVVNEEVVAAALRIPAKGSWLCNVSMGASSTIAEPDSEELEMARIIVPKLFEKGIVLFGFDTLVGDDGKRVLSEINTSCVNGIYPADFHSQKPVIKNSVDLLWDYIKTYITINQ